MATIAEFYSSNLALEAKKGMRQKAKLGGTPGLAPLGYLNVRERIEGREIRTVVIDPERAPLIQWMFEAYASGEWTMSQLEIELARRGLRIPATAKRPARSVSIQHIDKMLVNRHYRGYVKFEGIWYEGRHPALIDQPTFDRVQAVRTARAETREKTQKHPHYLKGSVSCGQCGARLGIMNARNRWGTVYPYFYCLGRAKQRNCTQAAVRIADVEASVADWWLRVQLTEGQIVEIREHVTRGLVDLQARDASELDRQRKRVGELEHQRLKLLEARYADAIPLELFKAEQERITRELAGAQQIIERCSTEIEAVVRVVEEALLLCANAHRLYVSAPPEVRRQLNQAVFARFWIIDDRAQGADLTDAFAQLLIPDLARRLQAESRTLADTAEPTDGNDQVRTGRHGRHGTHRPADARSAVVAAVNRSVIERPNGLLPAERTNPGLSQDQGSNIPTSVELRGFEPLTPSMRTAGRAAGRRQRRGQTANRDRARMPAVARVAVLRCCTPAGAAGALLRPAIAADYSRGPGSETSWRPSDMPRSAVR